MKPSSAAAEYVCAILSSTFSTAQESSSEDYIQLSVMLQHSYRALIFVIR